MEAAIGRLHQEFMLLPGCRVPVIIRLHPEPARTTSASPVLGPQLESLDIARMRADARRALGQVGLGIDEWVAVANGKRDPLQDAVAFVLLDDRPELEGEGAAGHWWAHVVARKPMLGCKEIQADAPKARYCGPAPYKGSVNRKTSRR